MKEIVDPDQIEKIKKIKKKQSEVHMKNLNQKNITDVNNKIKASVLVVASLC